MNKNTTMYDEIGEILLEYGTLVCAVAEIPNTNQKIHQDKLKTVLGLKDAARTIMMGLIEKKIENHKKISLN